MKNLTYFCSATKGTIAATKCPIIPSPWQCVEKNCGSCIHDPACNFCAGSIDGVAWGMCKHAELAGDVCTAHGGTLSTTEVMCATIPTPEKTNDPIADKINEGDLNEATLNADINKDAGLGDLIVVVNVVTNAEALGDKVAKFHALLDVSAEGTAVDEKQKGAVCEALKKVVSERLTVKREGVDCSLDLKRTSQKRTISSFDAGITVDGKQVASASGLVASLGLSLIAIFLLA